MVVCVLTAAAGCMPSANEVAGRYSNASQTLDLRKDGAFEQWLRLPGGASLTNSGTWHLHDRTVDLTGYMVFDSEEKPIAVAGSIFGYKRGMLVDLHTGDLALKHD
jgi:hypothetical protein